jgi:hypothetical protein
VAMSSEELGRWAKFSVALMGIFILLFRMLMFDRVSVEEAIIVSTNVSFHVDSLNASTFFITYNISPPFVLLQTREHGV